jgi:hypothetical protein
MSKHWDHNTRTAQSLYLPAQLYHTWGHTERAEALYRRMLSLDEQLFGPDAPRTQQVPGKYILLLKELKCEDEAAVGEARLSEHSR